MKENWTELGKLQEDFAYKLSILIIIAHARGIKVRKLDCKRDRRLFGDWGEQKGYGEAFSVHKISLAQDLWTALGDDYVILHDIWDTLGGAPRILHDMNHFSFQFGKYW